MMSGQECGLESVVASLPMINEGIFVHIRLLKVGMARLNDAEEFEREKWKEIASHLHQREAFLKIGMQL